MTRTFASTSPFTIIDLGTLGGPTSEADAVNANGQVVGGSTTAAGESHAFSWTQAGGMLDLGTLGGGDFSYASAVNDNGQVVGWSLNPATGETHAFSWTQSGRMVDLGTLGGSGSEATAVNDNGQVVGWSTTASGEKHAFSWTQSGGMVDLGTLGGGLPGSQATAVNNTGQVVGTSATGAGTGHAFSWTQSGGIIDLGTLGGSTSEADAVNANGQVVGDAYTTTDTADHAFLWTQSGGMVDLGTLGGSFSIPGAINGNGQVVGYSGIPFTPGGGTQDAFSWTQAGGMVDLGTLGGPVSEADAVNANGQVVGWSWTTITGGSSDAFSWTPTGGMVDLGTLGGSISYATAVNDNGQVVGYSSTASGNRHAVLWRPGGQAVSPSLSTVSANPSSVQADGTSAAAVTVILRDSSGNPVSGKMVTLSQALSGGGTSHSTISGGGSTGSDGTVTFSVTDSTVENVTYTATDHTDGVALSQTATVSFGSPGCGSTSLSSTAAGFCQLAADESSMTGEEAALLRLVAKFPQVSVDPTGAAPPTAPQVAVVPPFDTAEAISFLKDVEQTMTKDFAGVVQDPIIKAYFKSVYDGSDPPCVSDFYGQLKGAQDADLDAIEEDIHANESLAAATAESPAFSAEVVGHYVLSERHLVDKLKALAKALQDFANGCLLTQGQYEDMVRQLQPIVILVASQIQTDAQNLDHMNPLIEDVPLGGWNVYPFPSLFGGGWIAVADTAADAFPLGSFFFPMSATSAWLDGDDTSCLSCRSSGESIPLFPPGVPSGEQIVLQQTSEGSLSSTNGSGNSTTTTSPSQPFTIGNCLNGLPPPPFSTCSDSGIQLLPGSSVSVFIHSAPVLLGVFPVDSNGTFSATVQIPADIPLGRHTLYAIGTAPDGSTRILSTAITVAADADLALTSTPPNITVNATSPTGATVSYTPPTATDEDASKPAVSCKPASASTFPIGTTTVTCSTDDTDDGNTPVSVSFTVTVRDTDLALASPPDTIIADATSPDGTTVTYTPPAAIDEDNPANASVSCKPASASPFQIGATTVTCSATDADDLNAPPTVSFDVHVKGALEQLQDLLAYVNGLPPGKSLNAKIQATIASYQANRIGDTCTLLTALTNEARAQSGKHLAVPDANYVINAASRVRSVIGC